MKQDLKALKPHEIEMLQRHPDDIQSIVDRYQLDVLVDESPKGTYKVVHGFGEKRLFNEYKAVIDSGRAVFHIRNGMINKQLSLEIDLHSCSVLSNKSPGSGAIQNPPG